MGKPKRSSIGLAFLLNIDFTLLLKEELDNINGISINIPHFSAFPILSKAFYLLTSLEIFKKWSIIINIIF